MIIDDVNFFKQFLPEEFIKFYDGFFSKKDENSYNFIEFYEISLIDEFLKDETKSNISDWKIFWYNFFVYIRSLLFCLQRDFYFEEYLKWSFLQIKKEHDCLKLLKSAFYYSKNNFDDMKSNDISEILLLLFTLDFVRKERISLENKKLTLLGCQFRNVSVQFFAAYDSKDLNEILDKVKVYAKKLQG